MSSTKTNPPADHGDMPLVLDDLSDIDATLMTLRKPTDLKKVIDSIPKPIRAVPKNGLPMWHRMGLESKLPVPKMPEGRVVFSRGKVGEDVRRLGLGGDGPRPTFDLSDPYCNYVSYDYIPMHDPHLAHHFSQKPARNLMKQLGYVTKDGRAVCTLKEFNEYRKYLSYRFMDRVHMEMKKLDERARDDLTLKRVEVDVARRLMVFMRTERAREHIEKASKERRDEEDEKKRRVKEQEDKIHQRMKLLSDQQAKQKEERQARAKETETRIRQRLQAAAELELRRKITMIRTWRRNEKKRINRQKQQNEQKKKHVEDEANRRWSRRVESQNQKIQEETLLLNLYAEDMAAGARRRKKRAEIYAYNTELELQRIRLTNWKALHGAHRKKQALIKKMGVEFEKSKRGTKGMSKSYAHALADAAMKTALANQGDALMTLAQARGRMDVQTLLPAAPVMLLDEMLETSIMVFIRRRVHLLLRDVERAVRLKASKVFFANYRTSVASQRRRGSKGKSPRWSIQLTAELAQQFAEVRGTSIQFGDVIKIKPEDTVDVDLKSVKDRPPTPVPSLTKLAEVTFADKQEDLPDPVTIAKWMPERKRLLETVNLAAKLLSRCVSFRVQKGMDTTVGKVTLPHLKTQMEWGEAVEGVANAVIANAIQPENPELRRTISFLAHRILRMLMLEMKDEKFRRKSLPMSEREGSGTIYPEVSEDAAKTKKMFYDPKAIEGKPADEKATPVVTVSKKQTEK